MLKFGCSRNHSLVTSILLYACDSLTLTAELQTRIQAMEMRCHRKILHISFKTMLPTRKSVPRSSRRTTQRPPDDRKETQTAVVWSCSPFIGSGQNHLARHSEREEDKADREWTDPWSSASPRGQWRTGKYGENWSQNHLWCPNAPHA